MSLQTHLAALGRRHAALEQELSEAIQHPSIDSLELTWLKRQKLAIKDKMERLRAADALVGAH